MKKAGFPWDAILLLFGSILLCYFVPWGAASNWSVWPLRAMGAFLIAFGIRRLATDRPLGIRLIAMGAGPFVLWLIIWQLAKNDWLP
jgi:hypothetical protein